MSENKDNKLTLINEKTANDYLTHTRLPFFLLFAGDSGIIAHRITAKEEEFEWITVIFQV